MTQQEIKYFGACLSVPSSHTFAVNLKMFGGFIPYCTNMPVCDNSRALFCLNKFLTLMILEEKYFKIWTLGDKSQKGNWE